MEDGGDVDGGRDGEAGQVTCQPLDWGGVWSPQAEADGPFNFRKLLRKTSAAPTDSLRMRHNIQSFVLEGEIQVL